MPESRRDDSEGKVPALTMTNATAGGEKDMVVLSLLSAATQTNGGSRKEK
jgi:hypothetical protein